MLNFLIDLTSSKTVRTTSGMIKKIYKYSLMATLNNIITGKLYSIETESNLKMTNFILNNAKDIIKRDQFLLEIKNIVDESFKKSYFIEPYNNEKIDKFYLFFRKKLEDIEKGNRFSRASEYKDIIDLSKYFKTEVKDYHLIDFNLNQGIVLTMPDMLSYIDLINCYNLFIETKNNIKSISYENFNSIDSRTLMYSFETQKKMCLISCVSFVEAFLHYLFYNYKYSSPYKDDPTLRSLYMKPERLINDKDILSEIVEPKLIGNSPNVLINSLIKKYKNSLEIRDSIIHTTAIENAANNTAYIELQFNLSDDLIKESIINSINLVIEIDKLLPSDIKLLFWMDSLIKPDFNKNEKIVLFKEK